MKVAIVGAGPAGLYLALLLGKALPDAEIVVHEQNPVDATYGFGVALHSLGWERLRAADAASCDDLLAAATITRDQIIGHKGTLLRVDASGANAGIGRLALLGVLRRHAEAAGARIVDKARIEPGALPQADLVVGADGVNSVVRATYEAAFDPIRAPQHNRLAWYGCDRKVEHPFLIFKQTRFGWFWSVGYAHSETMSTFVAECDAEAYVRSGLSEMSLAEQTTFASEIFADELEGARLLDNNSVWRALTMVDAQAWSVGNAVLIGDALHSADPTIGSGTRMALDDAAALARAVTATPDDLPAALAAYRAAREPSKRKLLDARDASIAWYEAVGETAARLDPCAFALSYMTRTGRVTLDRLRAESPAFMARCEAGQ